MLQEGERQFRLRQCPDVVKALGRNLVLEACKLVGDLGGSTSSLAEKNWPTLIISPPMLIASARKRTAARRLRSGRLRRATPRRPMRGANISQKMKPRVTRPKKNTMRQ